MEILNHAVEISRVLLRHVLNLCLPCARGLLVSAGRRINYLRQAVQENLEHKTKYIGS